MLADLTWIKHQVTLHTWKLTAGTKTSPNWKGEWSSKPPFFRVSIMLQTAKIKTRYSFSNMSQSKKRLYIDSMVKKCLKQKEPIFSCPNQRHESLYISHLKSTDGCSTKDLGAQWNAPVCIMILLKKNQPFDRKAHESTPIFSTLVGTIATHFDLITLPSNPN